MRGFGFQGTLASFSSRPYWQRAWIRQELHFAKRVTLLCGDRAAPAKHLVELYQLLSGCPFDWTLSSEGTQFPTQSVDKADLPLWNLLEMYSQSKCSDPHDRIYSLLSMASEKPRFRGYEVNYGAPYDDVVVKTAAFCGYVVNDDLFWLLGHKEEKNAGYTTQIDVLLQYAQEFHYQHKNGKSWEQIMQVSFRDIRERFLLYYRVASSRNGLTLKFPESDVISSS